MKRILIIIGVSAILVATGILFSASSLQVPSGTWVPVVGGMASARIGAATVLLQDGRILVTGGNDPINGPTNTAEFFGANGSFSPAPSMNSPHSGHVAVLLQDGRVLVAGGSTSIGVVTNSAEIFDPVANSWTNVTGGMAEARTGHSAAVLQDGRVLIAGGQNGSAISSTLEIFDPAIGALGAFTSTEINGTMSSPRTQHAMTVLQDGRVLIVGGNSGNNGTPPVPTPVASTDIFDPVAGTVSAGPPLSFARFGHTATTLLNGQVVVIGGNNGNADPTKMDVTPAEMFDPTAATPAFTALWSNLATPREGHLAFLLPNNNSVLIVGGTSGGATVASAELFTPQESPQGVWTYLFGSTGSMIAARSSATGAPTQVTAPSSVMQSNGVLVVAGGNDANGNELNSAEAYGFPTVQTDQSDYPPGTLVTITGSGFQPNEAVTIQLVESPLIDTHGPYPVTADANGNISDSSFRTDLHDVNVMFTLSAVGPVSQAQTTFTDAAVKKYHVGLSPTTTAAGASTNYSFTVTSDASSTVALGSATITLPTGYTSISTGTVTSPSGTHWTASISGNVVTVTANTGGDKLNGGQPVSVPITATAPCTAGSPTWPTTAGSGVGSSDFINTGADPSVTVTGSCTATITVNKTLVPSGDPGKFNLQIDGSTAGTGGNVGNGGTTGAITVTGGVSHTVAETAVTGTSLANYATAIVCKDASNNTVASSSTTSVSFTPTAGGTYTCTITNTGRGKLHINKTAVGGNATFGYVISGPTSSNPSITTASGAGTTGDITVTAGSYTINEGTIPANWVFTSLSCSTTGGGGSTGTQDGTIHTQADVTLNAGDTVTCSYTNTGQGKIQIVKDTTAGSGDGTFNFSVAGPNSYSNSPGITTTGNTSSTQGTGQLGSALTVNAGSGYSVTETVPTNWRLASVSCSDGTNTLATNNGGSFAVATGVTVTCTYTNTGQGKIQVVKDTTAGSGDGTFNFSVAGPNSYSNSPGITTTGNTASVQGTGQLATPLTVDAGSGYSVTETVPTNWRLASVSCSNGVTTNGGSFTVATGVTVTCTYTNTGQGKIQVVKDTTAGSGDGTFNFSVAGPSSSTPSVTTTGNTSTTPGTGQLATPLTVDAGSGYSVSETVPTNWRLASVSCSNGVTTNGGSFTVATGVTVTCTYTNTGQGKIQVVKDTTAGSGDGTFNFSVAGPSSSTPSVTTTGNTSTTPGTGQLATPLTVDAGSGYSVSETVPTNWRLASVSCSNGVTTNGGSFAVATGVTVTCTYTNTGQGKIQIVKDTTAGSGDTTFNFSVAGPSSSTPSVTTTGNTSTTPGTGQLATPLTVDAGSGYSVSETVPTNWRLASVSCSNGVTTNGGSFTVATGVTVTCTYTNTGQGKIQIVKDTTAGSGDTTFNFSVAGPSSSTPSVTTTGNTSTTPGTGQLATPLTVDAGSGYSVSETVPTNWRLASVSCSNGVTTNGGSFAVATGVTVTCTYTNTGQGKIQIVKDTTAGSGDTTFNFSVAGPSSSTPSVTTTGNTSTTPGTGQLATPLTVDAGSGYSVSETVPTNWRLASVSCSNGVTTNGGSFTVATGVTVTCTYTNTGQGKIQVVKDTTAGSGDGTFNFSVAGPSSSTPSVTTTGNTSTTPGTGQLATPLTVDAGSGYSVSETVPTNWRLASVSCSNGVTTNGGSFAVATGVTVTCTYTNTGQGKIQVVKDTTAGSGDGTFNFSVAGPSSSTPSVTTTGNTSTTPGTGQLATPLTVDAGSGYSVSETVPTNWRLASVSCSNGVTTNGGSFVVATGVTVTCTYTNTGQGKIQVVKDTTAGSGDGTFNFSVAGPSSSTPSVTTTGNTSTTPGTGQLATPLTVDAGSGYSVSETVPTNWRLASVSCSNGVTTNGGSFAVATGVTVTCTYTNTGQGKIQIVKDTTAGSGDTTFNFSVAGPSSSTPSVTTTGNTSTTPGTGQLATPLTVDAGSGYSVSETVPTNWRLASVSCSNGVTTNGGSFVVATGVTVTCTYTNTGQGKIQVVKDTTAGSGDGTFNFSVAGPSSSTPSVTTTGNTSTTPGTGQLATPLTVDAGSGYSVSETVPTNWRLASVSCSNGVTTNGGSFAVATGATVTCTFTDVGQGTINITKNTLGGNGSFGFTVTGPTSSTPNVTTTGSITSGTGSQPLTVDVGTYSVGETSVPAPTWILKSSSCTSGTPSSFGVTTGGSVTCTFNNTNRPTLTVTKTLYPSTGDTDVFNLLINGTPSAMNVGNGGTTGAVILNAGMYTVGESQGTNTSLANYFVLFGGACATNGTITLVNGENATCTITNVLATVTVTPTSTPTVGSQSQYSDPVTFTAKISADTSIITPALASSVTFYVGTPSLTGATSMGPCNLAPDGIGNLTCQVTAPLVDPGTPPQHPPTGNFGPGAHTVYAVFGGLNSAVYAVAKPTTPLTINQEDAQLTYTGLESFSTTTTATTMDVAVSYTLQDATATCPSAICDSYAGDITNAKVTLTLTGIIPPFNGSCSTLPVVAVAGEVDPTNNAPSTGTASCVIHNVPVPGAYTLAATPATGSYYTFVGETSTAISTANGGTGFITGGGHQTAAYLATPGLPGSGKYTTAGLLKPAPNTKMNFGFETKYNKNGSNLQGGANIIIRSACVTGIAGYTPVPGSDGLCVYQIKSNGNGNITSLSENLTAPKSPSNAVFTARNVTIYDVTRPVPLTVAGNVNLELNMYDVAEPGANADTLTIYVYDSVNGVWISNNWTGATTAISTSAPVIQGGNLQVH